MTVRGVRRSYNQSAARTGRLLLILGPFAYAAFVPIILDGSPIDGTEQTVSWLDGAVIAVVLAFCLALPLLLLPVSSAALITTEGESLSAQTVLGHRRLETASLTTRWFELPGNGWDWEVEILRDGAGRRVFVVGSQLWAIAGDDSSPAMVPGTALPWFVGWLVMLGWIALSVAVLLLPLLPAI